MSKKLLSVLLIVSLLLTLCACAKTPEPEEPAFPETITDESRTLIEGLPAIRFDGTWKKGEMADGEGYKTEVFYENQDPDAANVAFGIYSWEKTLNTLKEEAESARQSDYPKQEYLTLYEDDSWDEEGDFNYVYYCAFNETLSEDYVYSQACFFEVDGTIYELDYYVATEAIPLGDTGLQFYGPKCTEAIELDEADLENGMVACRHCTYSYNGSNELCDFDLYAFDRGNDTIENVTQWFYDNKDNVITVEPYTFTSRLGNEYEGLYLVYENVYSNGVAYYNITYYELVGDKSIVVNCYVPLENMNPYAMVSASAMSYAIIGY